jgi:CUB domain
MRQFFNGVSTACGGILTNETGNIISKNDGNICTYVIHVPRGSVIRLSWTKMRSESTTHSGNVICDSDFVQVFDNSSTVTPSQQIGM